MIDKLFGIDYKKWIYGEIGNAKLIFGGTETELFYTESEMLIRVAELKPNHCISDINVFTTPINRTIYHI